jgi:hypothetical protein
MDLIKRVFSEDEAHAIANIPLSPLLPKDRLIWRGTSNGVFTVRNAYHSGKEVQDSLAAQCSNSAANQDIWKAIWATKVPHPIKTFIWRACHNAFPTRDNLMKRKVVDSASCPCCGGKEENLIHAIWECPAAQDVWG